MLIIATIPLISVLLLVESADITRIKAHRLPLGYKYTEEEDAWRRKAVEKLWKEREEMGHTPLVKFQAKGFPNVDFFFKNETASKTNTLKHRFAWALYMWAIVDGKINNKSKVYDSTTGNSGASQAYICGLLGLSFTAVVSKDIEKEKEEHIISNGGKVLKVDVALRNFFAEKEAKKNGGFFMNQFANAASAEEYHESGNYTRESSNVFHEILYQLEEDEKQEKKIPDIFVHSAGSGGTISSVGRYIKRYNIPTKVVLADSEFSLLHDYVLYNKFTNESGRSIWKEPGIAGIGYGYNTKPLTYGETTSLTSSTVDESMKMPDIATVAAMHVLREKGIDGGASTALHFLVSLHKAYQLRECKDISGRLTIATVIGDPGKYYDSTYFNSQWINRLFADRGGMNAMKCWMQVIEKSVDIGSDFLQDGLAQC